MDSKHNAENPPEKKNIQRETTKTPSLKTLIDWNISKALKSNPEIDLKVSLREAEKRLNEAHDSKALVSPDARNLCCALLAWQQLGHRRADSLFNFIQTLKEEEFERERNMESLYKRTSEESGNHTRSVISPLNVPGSNSSSLTPCQWGSPTKMDFSTSIGLVVNLPRDPQMVMCLSGPVRVLKKSNKSCSCASSAKKPDSACCLDKKCMERLTSMEAETKDLSARAGQFARRETRRSEQLERAEMAWRDLDAGYQRRLRVAKEKEQEYEKQMARVLDERNKYKKACMPLVDALKKKSAVAEKEQETLKQLEKEMCSLGCARLQLSENAARVNAQLTDQQCKCSQLDRNLAWKEENERSKQRALEDAAEVAKVLTQEAECAQRAELEALRRQVAQVSQDLLEEDTRTGLLKKRIDDYMKEKNEMIEDLEACQTKCEGRMGALVKDLKCKKDKLAELKDKMMECCCKEPVDEAVEVKRTPSLAALCKCSPSDTIQESCSCASIRSRLLSSLLKDLFNGLKSEMETIGSQMPCHLLKCLEDKHNWDKTTDVKQNVRAYFSRLLLGELDIAIATVIERSHAQWVGECCVDKKKPQVSRDSGHSLRWQEHELEMKTQKLATELAAKMFREKAKELAKLAQEELKDSRPPCECDLNDTAQYSSALYRCLVPPYPNGHMNKMKNGVIVASSQVQRRNNPIPHNTQNRISKKDANETVTTLPKYVYPADNKIGRKYVINRKPESTLTNKGNACKPATTRRVLNLTGAKKLKSCTNKANPYKVGVHVPNKLFKEPQQYAVNMCLCDNKKESTSSISDKNFNMKSELCHSYNSVSNLRQQKPILDFRDNSFQDSDNTSFPLCSKIGACLHKTPSNTSIDRLLSVLTKWKDNLVESQDCNIQEIINTHSLFKITHSSIVNILQEIHDKTDKTECKNSKTFEKCAEAQQQDMNVKSLKDSKKTLDAEYKCPEAIISRCLKQPKQSKLLIAINLSDDSHHCDNNNKNIESNTNRPLSIMPSVKYVPVKADIQKKSIEDSFPITNKINLDNYSGIDTSINKNNKELKLPVTNIAECAAVRCQDGEKCIQCLGATLANAMRKRLLIKNDNHIFGVEQRNSNNVSTTINKHDIKEIGDVAEVPAGKTNTRCQNYIQFLGVTLDSTNINMLLKRDAKKSRNQKSYKRNRRGNLFENKQGNSHDKSDHKLVKLSTNKDIRKTKYAINRIKALNVLHVHNECVYPRTKVENLNENKSVEVQNNSNDVLSPDEPCVCCPIIKADNTNDLEVNAFQLLEEHLKSKLDELRRSACKSSCIPNADEKSILGDTIVKVKKLILESANKVTCKCAGNNQPNSGSWNRAYSLLQEYLKTKIDHVKCTCSSVENSRDENLVTRVLNQISCLIENDLQRLKNICNSNDTTLDTISKWETHITHKAQHSISNLKNATDKNNMTMTQVVESKFVSYTNGVSLPHNKSAQVLLRPTVETKSCDALKIYSKYSEVQTLDVMKTNLVIDNSINSESDDVKPTNQRDTDISTTKSEKKSNLHPDMQNIGLTKDTTPFQKADITVFPIVMSPGNNINENVSKKNNLIDDRLLDENVHVASEYDKLAQPFLANIGCTINCCCDRDLGCVCTKSTVPSNAEWLRTNDIFKTFTQKQSVLENVSYILKSIPNKIPKNKNSIEDHSEDVHVTEKIKMYNLNSRESNVEGNIYFGRYKQKVHVVNDYYKAEWVHESKTNVCESGVNAIEENHIYLKQSNQRFDIIHNSSNTLTDESSLQFNSMPPKSKNHGILKRNAHELFKHVPMSFSNSDTALIADHESQRSESLSTDCDCAMVPICHVKMLVENIGNKLVKAECTCDSLKSVCPIHS